MLRTTALLLVLPVVAGGQTLPATHAYSGLDATSARHRIERSGPRPYGPRHQAAAMPCAAALEHFPGLRLPNQAEYFKRELSPIRVVKPTFRLPEQNLGIADVHDAIFFAANRLVRFRLYLKSAGDSLAKRWTDHLCNYFHFLDRDRNGALNRYETEFAFSNAGVAQMLRTGFAYQRPDDAARMFADLDVDIDGRVSLDEFAAYYAPSAGRIISVQPTVARDLYADTLTNNLFKLFDTNSDGRLSQSELNAVEGLFVTLDSDEDECLSATEIVPNLLTRPVNTQRTPGEIQQSPMIAFETRSPPTSIASMIISRYDRNKNGMMDKSENPFSDDVYLALDKNRNNEVSVTELSAWSSTSPDLSVELTFGNKQEECAVKLIAPRNERPSPLIKGFRVNDDGSAVFTIANQAVQLACYSPRGIYRQQGRRVAPFQFPNNPKGYITDKDLPGPQFQALRVMFDMIDRDADGKMTPAEFDGFFALQGEFMALPLALVHSAQTPSLFQVLDGNADGRLSVREVREAWKKLIALEPNGREFVTRAALAPQGALRFGRTAVVFGINPMTTYTQPAVRQPTRGPIWFRKFDRNGDGELSRREFPGREADFDRLDRDHDDYISFEEAERIDKALRDNAPKK